MNRFLRISVMIFCFVAGYLGAFAHLSHGENSYFSLDADVIKCIAKNDTVLIDMVVRSGMTAVRMNAGTSIVIDEYGNKYQGKKFFAYKLKEESSFSKVKRVNYDARTTRVFNIRITGIPDSVKTITFLEIGLTTLAPGITLGGHSIYERMHFDNEIPIER